MTDVPSRGARHGRAPSGGRGRGGPKAGATPGRRQPTSARAVAHAALLRIEDGAFANLVLPGLLERSGLERRDRAFVTDLVYGTTRMRRACDFLVDRHLARPEVDPATRAALRLGAQQLAFAGVPAHAAVSATVDVAPNRTRALVNAVLRKVAGELEREGVDGVRWPSEAVRLSYPDWIAERLAADLGPEAASAALRAMDEPAEVTERADGYVQDLASQWVVEAVGARAGERVADVCAAPGGKATALAATGAFVVAGDVRPARAGLVAGNAERLGAGGVATVVADGRRPPLRAGAFDRVLVDAPCSGLGVLRRRADARWRIEPSDVERLASLQRELLAAASELVAPGGLLAYSACTLTAAETIDVDRWAAGALPSFEPDGDAASPAGGPWEPLGRGARLLPQAAGTDGMYLLLLRRARR